MSVSDNEVLCATGLEFSYPNRDDFPVLEEVGFSLRSGEICALVGASGVGKSTLLKVLAGQLKPHKGTVHLSTHDAIQVLYHPQEAMLLPWSRVRENVRFGLHFSGAAPTLAVDTMLDKLQLAPLAERYPAQLSGGQIERTALARTLLTPARVYLLDEPLSGTDYVLKVQIEEFLVSFIRDRRASAVFVTHDLPQAVALSNFVIALSPGKSAARAVRISIPTELAALSPEQRRASPGMGPLVQKMLTMVTKAT